MRTPKKCAECTHIDDFIEYREEVNARLTKLEGDQGGLEATMKNLNDNLTTINTALMGDIESDRPGMVENMRKMQSHVEALVQIHEREAKQAIEETKNKKKVSFIESMPWKTITALVGILGGLVAIIWKLLSFIK